MSFYNVLNSTFLQELVVILTGLQQAFFKKSMTSIAIVFRSDKLNGKGEAPIHFRITKNRKSSYIASGIRIDPKMWNEKRGKIKTACANSARLNAYLSSKFAEIQDTVLQHETTSKSLTSKNLKEKVFGKRPSDFFAFADTVLDQYRKEGRVGSYQKNLSVVSKLKAYRSSLTFYDITPEFLAKYEQYLRDQLSNQTNTIHKDMKFLRKVFNDAIRSDVIEQSATPFRKYQLRTEKTHRDHLTEQELKRLEDCTAGPGTTQQLFRDMFVFAIYTGGLRISDILQLRWANFDGTHLRIVIQKTGAQVAIKVPDKGLEILCRYRNANNSKDDFIFPVLPSSLDLDDPVVLHSSIASATTQINRGLKALAKMAGIEKRLSFHISRHCFAVMALRKGISIDKVSKLMAHAAVRETQIYAKVVNEELDKAMDAFNA